MISSPTPCSRYTSTRVSVSAGVHCGTSHVRARSRAGRPGSRALPRIERLGEPSGREQRVPEVAVEAVVLGIARDRLSGSARPTRRTARAASARTPTLLCAAGLPPDSIERARHHLERFVEVTEHALVVAEDRPHRVVVHATELDARRSETSALCRRPRWCSTSPSTPWFGPKLGLEHHRPPHRRSGLVVALEILQRLAEVVPRLPLARRDRDERAQDLLGRTQPAGAPQHVGVVVVEAEASSARRRPDVRRGAPRRGRCAPSMSLRSASIAPSNCVARSSCGCSASTRRYVCSAAARSPVRCMRSPVASSRSTGTAAGRALGLALPLAAQRPRLPAGSVVSQSAAHRQP